MRFGSVCSGIEAASVAWKPLGWEAAWFSEIEPFPSAVLAHHYPDTPNHGDMTTLPARILAGEVEAPDLFCGGTPCQAFSVAGLRKSLDDARGNLSLTFVEIADAIDDVRRARGDAECVVFWENVPGVLSTADNAFGCFLGALAGCDTAIKPLAATGWTDAGMVAGPVRAVAWRVLDAQYFGLAQRRRRVFVVASAREGFDPAAVLFEFKGVRRDSAPSREAGQGTAVCPTLRAGGNSTGGDRLPGTDVDTADSLQVVQPYPVGNTLTARMHKGINSTLDEGQTPVLAQAFDWQSGGDSRGLDPKPTAQLQRCQVPAVMQAVGTDCYNGAITGDVAATIGTPGSSVNASGPTVMQPVAFTQNQRDEVRTLEVAGALAAEPGMKQQTYLAQPVTYDLFNVTAPINRQNRQPGDPCHTLARANAEHAAVVTAPTLTASNDSSRSPQSSEITAQVAAVVQATAVAVDTYNGTVTGELAATITASSGMPDATGPRVMQPVATLFIQDDTTPKVNEERAGCLRRDAGGEGACVMTPTMQVRRLTPRECERLQGFPDDYTLIPWRGKPASECPDGPRYKALGNSWAVPCVRWIGRRIAAQIA